MEQAENKRPAVSKGFYIAISVAETLAKLISIIVLVAAIWGFQDAMEIMLHEQNYDQKWIVLANLALPDMNRATIALFVMMGLLLACGVIRNKIVRERGL